MGRTVTPEEMKAGDEPGVAGLSLALHTISALPLDTHFPLFAHYPAMKLGVRESVRHYARLLVPLVESIMDSRPESAGWVLTAPPIHVMAAGANLLAWEMCRILGNGTPRQRSVRCIDLRYSRSNPQIHLNKRPEYSGSGLAHRIDSRRSRMEGAWAPKPDPADFRGRDVIVVNDINVTGTHQRFIQRNLETVAPARIHWIYIVQVDPDLGISHPELENSLNYLSLSTFEELAAVVAGADIEYTSRCISRLLRFSEEILAPFIRSLDESRLREICRLIDDEGAYREDEYKAKLALLREGGEQRW